jgi:hypothetical protein
MLQSLTFLPDVRVASRRFNRVGSPTDKRAFFSVSKLSSPIRDEGMLRFSQFAGRSLASILDNQSPHRCNRGFDGPFPLCAQRLQLSHEHVHDVTTKHLSSSLDTITALATKKSLDKFRKPHVCGSIAEGKDASSLSQASSPLLSLRRFSVSRSACVHVCLSLLSSSASPASTHRLILSRSARPAGITVQSVRC